MVSEPIFFRCAQAHSDAGDRCEARDRASDPLGRARFDPLGHARCGVLHAEQDSECELYRLPVPAGGQPELKATHPDLVEPQFIDSAGRIIPTELGAAPTAMYRIDPASGSVRVTALDVALVTCVEPDPRTAGIIAGALDGPPSHVYFIVPCSVRLPSAGPPGGGGNVQGIARDELPFDSY